MTTEVGSSPAPPSGAEATLRLACEVFHALRPGQNFRPVGVTDSSRIQEDALRIAAQRGRECAESARAWTALTSRAAGIRMPASPLPVDS
jgi:hypothetical protein